MKLLNFCLKDFIIYIFIVVLSLLDLDLYALVSIPYPLSKYWGFYQKFLLVVVAFVLFCFTGGWRRTSDFLKIYLITVCISSLLIYIYSTFTYPSNKLYNVIFQFNQYFLVFLAFPLFKIFKKYGYNAVFDILNVIVFFWYIICIFQSIAYNYTGHLFLNISENVRSDSLRIDFIGIPNIMFIYNFCRVFYDKVNRLRIFNSIQLFLGAYCIIFIQQTRAYYIVFLCAIFAIIVFYKKMTIFRLMFILASLLVVAYFGINSGFLDSFGPHSVDYNSTVARQHAYGYFWQTFIHNPIFGHGIIASVDLLPISTGPSGVYFYADVGFVGALAQTGVFAFVLYVAPICYGLFCVYKRIYKRNVDPFIIGFLMFVIVSSSTLLCTNNMRSFIWPFFIALIAYVESSSIPEISIR